MKTDNVRYSVSVRFSSNGKLTVSGNEITISLKSVPERGRANAELLKKLSKHFNVDRSRIRIVSGLSSRKKVVEVSQ
ncbi:MAG TPA: DUF167 domain-containing protein [Nitrososphaera sp.]|jgi:hypothetical protein